AVGKQAAIRESTGGAPGCKRSAGDGQVGLTCRNVSMRALADELSAAGSGYFDAPVADGTGLRGAYDVSLNWTPRAQLGSEMGGVSLFDALREAGLTVARGKRPAAALIVDRVNRRPTPNTPGVAVELPPQPPEFDVAELTPSGPESAGKRNAVRNGHIELYRTTLAELIATAYRVDEKDLV